MAATVISLIYTLIWRSRISGSSKLVSPTIYQAGPQKTVQQISVTDTNCSEQCRLVYEVLGNYSADGSLSPFLKIPST